MIPVEKKICVEKALQATFGVKEFEEITELTAGLSSALVFKIVVKGNAYLLRIITRTDALSDPTNQYSCMQMAAEAGLAPHVLYTNIEDRVSITDFIHVQPFPIAEARSKMAVLLKKLHSLPPFPPRKMNIDFVQRLAAAHILPEDITTEILRIHKQITEVYRREEQDLVSCHSDLKPENVLFDGTKPWLVDWEAAFREDRYADLAIVANFVVRSDDEEIEFLENYFGEPADEYKQAKFFLMQQALHIQYFAVFCLFGSAGKPIDVSAYEPNDFRDFHNRIWSGEISLAGNEPKIQYALVHQNQLLSNIQTRRFDDSLRIVSACSK